jgi:Zn-dependent protease with chaperone function
MNLRWTLLLLASLALMAAASAGCQTDPISGLQKPDLFSVDDDIRFGKDAMKQFLQLSREEGWWPTADPDMQAKCEDMLDRIKRVSALPDLPWAIYYTDNPEVNAFALPGGQIMVFAGIWKMVKDDDELAAVIAHEVTHAAARHGTEGMTAELALQVLAAAIQAGAAASGSRGAGQASNAINQLIQILVPAYSRKMETEADHYGMLYMAKAGYNPRAAIRVWERAARSDTMPVDIYANHPSNTDRLAALTALLPEAADFYKRALAGEDFAAAAGPAWDRGGRAPSDPYEIRQLPAALPAETLNALKIPDGALDVSNRFIDKEKGRVTVVAANRTGKNIASFVLDITFYDKDKNVVTTHRYAYKRYLDKGKDVLLAFSLPPGATEVVFEALDIKFE